jgi:hypothetical protein
MEHIAIAHDTENIQAERPEFGAQVADMPPQGTLGTAARGMLAYPLHQEFKGMLAFRLLQSVHHQWVLGGSEGYNASINNQYV